MIEKKKEILMNPKTTEKKKHKLINLIFFIFFNYIVILRKFTDSFKKLIVFFTYLQWQNKI